MRKRLYLKFLLGYIIFAIVGIIIINVFLSPKVWDKSVTARTSSLYDQASLISKYYEFNKYENLDDYYNASLQLNATTTTMDCTIWAVNVHGAIRYDSSKKHMVGTKLNDFDPGFFGSHSSYVGSYYTFDSDNTITVIVPITRDFHIYGYILLVSSDSSLTTDSYQSDMSLIYGIYAIFLIITIIFLTIFAFNVYRPLHKISDAAKAYSRGLLDYGSINVKRYDEFGILARNLEHMADQLSRLEEYQHKFIANISHDFRSPLTSIKGYIEAILDGTIPEDKQEHYLNVVLTETERLNKLTSNLLTINAWDNDGKKITTTDFDINQVIKNTFASFEGVCTKRKIVFDLILGQKVYIVTADMPKIQQVIYNLVDNALKFSPNNSSIRISVVDRYEKIFVSIKDRGIGIPKSSLNKIWDRFYKTDLSRGKDKNGSGLGLAITKEIITSHKENIDVISTEGVGTEFIFSLTKAKQK